MGRRHERRLPEGARVVAVRQAVGHVAGSAPVGTRVGRWPGRGGHVRVPLSLPNTQHPQ